MILIRSNDFAGSQRFAHLGSHYADFTDRYIDGRYDFNIVHNRVKEVTAFGQNFAPDTAFAFFHQ